MPTSTLGNIISTLRTQKNLTQDELAKRAKLHTTIISNIEKDIISPTIDNLSNIAKALNINIYDLFTVNIQRKSLKIYQPYNGTLGKYLIAELKSNKYKRFNISVAYAKTSGVLRIKSAMESFRANDGIINCYIGIDQYNTTYEALLELFNLCDNLYIIHNESFSHTYHPKVYMLDNNTINPTNVCLSIGSNNLTAGGLFINYESCVIDFLDINNFWDKKAYEDTLDLFNRYTDANNNLSLLIDSKAKIEELLENNYIKTEDQSKISPLKSHSKKTKAKLFGSETFKAPSVDQSQISTSKNITLNQSKNDTKNSTDNISHTEPSVNIIPETISDYSISESFWFEMRKSTGGSRNILDLSSTAKLQKGSVNGTKYSTGKADIIYGGVKFFDMDPTMHYITKDIKILYKGNYYYPSTILYASNNQSWRIQLKGHSSTDDKALSQYGVSDFVDNILLFHKISTNNYILEIVDSSQINNLKSKSIFYATNGNSKNSKAFGKLR